MTVVAAGSGVSPRPTAVEVPVDAQTSASFQNIQFLKTSAEIQQGTPMRQLSEIARAMVGAGTEKFLIEGHTCDIGSESQNLDLSRKRALAVKEVLEKFGVDGSRLQVIGCGESEPLVPNTDDAARAQNRRVQIFRKL
jgi:outer membrane protein OmpA-like peptidoglycan-associated protein